MTEETLPHEAPAKPDNEGASLPDPARAIPPVSTAVGYRPPAAPGVVIAGRYTLVEKIGEGGMGEVWVAKQTEPVKRKVALKLIKAGMDSKAVLARFEQERQALAMMDHPNIARVLDGGLTADRRPLHTATEDRCGRHGRGVGRPAVRTGQAQGGPQARQGRHGFASRARAL